MTVVRPQPAQRLLLDLVRDGRSVRYVARGDSMWPTITSGSVMEIAPCSPATLRAGELAAFERDGWVVVHRVVRVADGHVRFVGDALERGDGDVPFDRVLGRARVIERRPLRLRVPGLSHIVRALRATRRRLAL